MTPCWAGLAGRGAGMDWHTVASGPLAEMLPLFLEGSNLPGCTDAGGEGEADTPPCLGWLQDWKANLELCGCLSKGPAGG